MGMLKGLSRGSAIDAEECLECGHVKVTWRYFINRAHFKFMRMLEGFHERHTRDMFPGAGKASPDVYMLVDLEVIERTRRGFYALTVLGQKVLNGVSPIPCWVDRKAGKMISWGPAHYINEFVEEDDGEEG